MYGYTVKIFLKFLYVMGLVAVVAGEMTKDYCSIVEIEAAKRECHDVYAGGHHGNLETICENVECYLQCLKDATGDCSNRDLLFKEDIELYKALYRARCVNATFTQMAEELCVVQTPCIDDIFNTEQVNTMHTLTNMSSDLETKILECRFSSKSKSCITVTPNNSCTPEMARLQKSITVIKHSLSQCNISQDHTLFDKYGGDIKCRSPKIKSKCFTASVMSRVAACKPVTLTSFMSQSQTEVKNICDDVECISQCYSQEIGECYQKDQFVMLDPEMIKISTRAACDNVDGLASTIKTCRMTDRTCLLSLAKSVTTAHMLIQRQKYAEYKDLVCRATSKFRSCIVFGVSENCTEKMATFAKNMYEVWHSYSACGPSVNALTKKHSGKLTCEKVKDKDHIHPASESRASLQNISFINFLLLSIVYLISMI